MESTAVKIHELKYFWCSVGRRNSRDTHEISYRGGGDDEGVTAKIKVWQKSKEVSTLWNLEAMQLKISEE